MTHDKGQLVSVNIGGVREVEHNGRVVRTGIFKSPTPETQRVSGDRIGDDVQADTAAHGGPDKAIYAYASEDYDWWATQIDRDVEPGLFGENLTTRGIDVSAAQVGERWRIGSATLEVSEPRIPCFKLGLRTEVARIQQLFSAADRPGAYLRIIEPGHLTVGDDIERVPAAESSITVSDFAAIYHRNRGDADRLLAVPRVSTAWRAWVEKTLANDRS